MTTTFTYGANLPKIPQLELDSKFKYNLWAPHLKQYDLNERLLSTTIMRSSYHVAACLQSAVLMCEMWNILRDVFSDKNKSFYDRMFDNLRDMAQREFDDYQMLRVRSAPYTASPAPTPELVRGVQMTQRNLGYLAHKCGFGNETQKTFDDSKNIFEE